MQKKEQSKKTHFKPRFFLLLALLCAASLGAVWYSQEQKLSDIKAEQVTLTERYEALKSEEQRIGYLIEYAQSKEYLLLYAREKLGYVAPGDIKFDIQD